MACLKFENRQQGLSPRLARGLVGRNRRHDGHGGVDLQMVFPGPLSTRAGKPVLKCARVKPVRETLLGMVDAVSDAKWRAWLDRMRTYRRRLV